MNTIITMHELKGLTDQELGELHQLLTLLLSGTDQDTQESRNIMVSLENITRVGSLKGWAPAPRQPSMRPQPS